MTRIYGDWPGKPEGTPENLKHCIAQVWPKTGFPIPHQCSFKRGHGPDGLYCKIHAKKKDAQR